MQIPRRMAVSDKAECRITKDRMIGTVCFTAVWSMNTSTEHLLEHFCTDVIASVMSRGVTAVVTVARLIHFRDDSLQSNFL